MIEKKTIEIPDTNSTMSGIVPRVQVSVPKAPWEK
jgi:hypothetical protein